MGEMEDKLNAILNDPSAMGQIMALAQSLGKPAPPAPKPEEETREPGWERTGAPPPAVAGLFLSLFCLLCPVRWGILKCYQANPRKESTMARKILFPLCFVLALALTSCAPAGQTAAQDDGTTHLVATTYPVYLFTAELVKGVEGITVDLMIDQPISCLHDYTLSVKDMKTLERADLIILSGAGLEETMEDALDTVSDTPQIDCAQGIALLESSHDHDHGHDDDDRFYRFRKKSSTRISHSF